MEELGDLGFWLMIGMIVAAKIVSAGVRERDRERERQATLRLLLEKDERSVTEVLAYLRERDAADAAATARERARDGKAWRRVPAVLLGFIAFALGFFAYAAVRDWSGWESAFVPVVAMLATWAAGTLIAWWVWPSTTQENDARPGG
jgi:hypothetical protein